MARTHNPYGSRLSALEKNILKYRALEMIMVLQAVEDLRKHVLATLRTNKSVRRALDMEEVDFDDLKPKTALKYLVQRKVLSESQGTEIANLIRYRNLIAHEIESLVGDIGSSSVTRDWRDFQNRIGGANFPRYDYSALKRIKFYKSHINTQMRSKYVISISLTPLLFDAAERAFEEELRRLRSKIERQLEKRKLKFRQLNSEISIAGTPYDDEWVLGHPRNKYDSGKLTKRGIEVCYGLFLLGKRPLVVAYLMRISLRSASTHYKNWCKTLSS